MISLVVLFMLEADEAPCCNRGEEGWWLIQAEGSAGRARIHLQVRVLEVAGWPRGSDLEDMGKGLECWQCDQPKNPQPTKEKESVDHNQEDAMEATGKKMDGFHAEGKGG
ncbi:UNVERIFIED_CONTAM: hypothetical protein K2H54_061563 [Gekko kuhli]